MAKRHTARLACAPLEDRRVPAGGLDLTAVEWRTIDGTNNNLALPNQGAAETRQIRIRPLAAGAEAVAVAGGLA